MGKLGLMGGTFDPIHKAHIAMANAAAEQFALDRVLFMTGGNPPHKTTQTDAKIRHHMVKLALEGRERLVACDAELHMKQPSYTIRTLQYLKEAYPEGEIYFMIGGDSLRDFFDWYQPEEILRNCTLLVYPRDGYPTDRELAEFCEKHQARAERLHIPEEEISSTVLRKKIQAGENAEAWFPESVWAYLQRIRLYREPPECPEVLLKTLLREARYRHSVGVMQMAEELAKRHGADPEKARTAGLLHDCAKNLEEDLQKQLCLDLEIELDETEKRLPGLWHPKLGAELAKLWFGVRDEEILEAIRWHTIGKAGMDKLSKIIFAADMVETGRAYPEAEELRRIVRTDLDEGVYACARAVILWNRKRGREIHPNAYAVCRDIHPEEIEK